jgi:hypothetical protein
MQHGKLSMAIVLASALISAAMAQSASNAESCLDATWGYLRATGYEYGAVNTCTYPLAVSFKPRNGPMVQKTVEPGQAFRTGLTYAKFEADRKKSGWVATICRAGEVPDRTISDSTWDAILGGKYACRKP